MSVVTNQSAGQSKHCYTISITFIIITATNTIITTSWKNDVWRTKTLSQGVTRLLKIVTIDPSKKIPNQNQGYNLKRFTYILFNYLELLGGNDITITSCLIRSRAEYEVLG